MLSPLLLLKEQGPLSTSDIAKQLEDSHQLTTQRINALQNEGYIKSAQDKSDLRRRTNSLTAKGKREAAKIEVLAHQLEMAYESLFKEMDADLFRLVNESIVKLRRKPIAERIPKAHER